MIKTRKIIEASNTTKECFNILTFPTHERYETQLCKTGHNFYSFVMPNQKTWNIDQTPLPINYFPTPAGKLLDYIDFDFILVQSKFWQYQVAHKINQYLKLPVIVLEHTLPVITQSTEQIDAMKTMLGDINVFISEYSQRQWGIHKNVEIIYHGIDTQLFKDYEQERDNKVLSVANNFINRDYCLNFSGWSRSTENVDVTLIGDNVGLSQAAKSAEELVDSYNRHSIFLNTSTHSPIPMSLLEAMSCGCAIVSTATCMIPEIITNGENGFISNNEEDLKNHIHYLLSHPEKAKSMGKNARQTILEKFNEDSFIQQWQNIFHRIGDILV